MHYFHTLYKRTNTVADYKKNIDFSQYNPRQQEIMKETLATLQLFEERQQARKEKRQEAKQQTQRIKRLHEKYLDEKEQAQKEKRQKAKQQAQINQDINTKIK